jgi:hypothetical protein
MVMTALLVWDFVFIVLNVLRGVVPVVTLFSSFIYAFGCLSVDGVLLRVPPDAAVVVIVHNPSFLRLASSPEYRLCGRSLRTAIPNAFFCPLRTTSFLPRVNARVDQVPLQQHVGRLSLVSSHVRTARIGFLFCCVRNLENTDRL